MAEFEPRQRPFGGASRAGEIWDRLQLAHPYPLGVLISVTNDCNLSCGHCARPRHEATQKNLSGRELIGLFDELVEAGTLGLTLTGGEPGLRSDLEELVAAAVARRFVVKIKSNATLLDERRVDALSDAGIAGIEVSLYHHRAEEHDRFVGQSGAWRNTVRTMDRFRGRGVEVLAAIILMDWNARSTGGIISLCEEHGFAYRVDPHVAPAEDGDLAPCQLRASQSDLEKILSDPRLVDVAALGKEVPRPADSYLCQAGHGSAFVNFDGELWPCARLNLSMGNVTQTRFRDLWRCSDVRKQLDAVRWGDLPECGACDLSFACSRCPAIALTEHGNWLGRSDVACRVARALATACRAEEVGH